MRIKDIYDPENVPALLFIDAGDLRHRGRL